MFNLKESRRGLASSTIISCTVNLKPSQQLERSEILSVCHLLYFLPRLSSRYFIEFLSKAPNTDNELVQTLKDLIPDPNYSDYLDRIQVLSPSAFLYQLSNCFPEIHYKELSHEEFLQNFSVASLKIPNKKQFIFFRLPEISLENNVDVFNFMSHRLENTFELYGIIFKKHRYYISLCACSRGWVLYKATGQVRFLNWAEGTAAAHEMGFTIHILFYVKSSISTGEPENLFEVGKAISELSKAYSGPISRYTYI